MANIRVAIGRHPVHGLVAHNTQQNPNADHLLRGLGFTRVPGHYLYRLDSAEGIETEVGSMAVRLLRSIGYDVDADVAFEGDLEPVAEPDLSAEPAPVPYVEPVVTFDRHPMLGIMATASPSAGSVAHERLTAAGFYNVGDNGAYMLPYGTPLDEALDIVDYAADGLAASRIPFEASNEINRPASGQPLTRNQPRAGAITTMRRRLEPLAAFAQQRLEPVVSRVVAWVRHRLDALRTPPDPQPKWLPGSLPPPRERPAPGMVWQQVPIAPRTAEQSTPRRAVPLTNGQIAQAPSAPSTSRDRAARSTSTQTPGRTSSAPRGTLPDQPSATAPQSRVRGTSR